jgi:hypothetical protein
VRSANVEAGRRAPAGRTFFASPLEDLSNAGVADTFGGAKAVTDASDADRRKVRFRGARVVIPSREPLGTGVSLPLK